MKHFLTTFSTFSIVLLVVSIMNSCQDDGNLDSFPQASEAYMFEIRDTTVTAQANEFVIHLKEGLANLPDLDKWNLKVGVEDDAIPGNIVWSLVDVEKSAYFLNYDWISFEKIITHSVPALCIQIKENSSYKHRKALLQIELIDKKTGCHLTGHLKIKQKGRPDTEPFEMNIRYRGITYTSLAHINLSEELIIHDAEFESMLNQIEKTPGVEAVVREEGIVDYYDEGDKQIEMTLSAAYKDLITGLPCKALKLNFETRGADAFRFMNDKALGYCALFDDKDFTDTYGYSNLFDLNSYKDINNMKNVSLNDKVTSLAVAYKGDNPDICAVLTVWEDTDYNHGDNDRTKHRISFIATKENPQISWGSLKNIKCIGSSNSWNDRISSISFHFGYTGTEPKPY